MPAKSTIDRLPDEVLEQLQTLLRDGDLTQVEVTEEVNALLLELGLPELQVSKSAVNRYSMKMEKVGERMRQSREISRMWMAKLGNQPQGQLGSMLNEMLRTVVFDLVMQLQDQEIDEKTAPKLIKPINTLALTLSRLEKAASDNQKREDEIRKQAMQEAAEAVDQQAKQAGLTKEAADQIKSEILGIAA